MLVTSGGVCIFSIGECSWWINDQQENVVMAVMFLNIRLNVRSRFMVRRWLG